MTTTKELEEVVEQGKYLNNIQETISNLSQRTGKTQHIRIKNESAKIL